MRATYDEAADAAYIYLTDRVGPGESAKQILVDDDMPGMVVFDLDDEEHVIGIEILNARSMLRPETIESFTAHPGV